MTRYGRSIDASELTLTPAEDRALASIRSHRCNLCGRAVLIAETGPHARLEHPTERPSFSRKHVWGRIPETPWLSRCIACGWGWKWDADNDRECSGAPMA